MKSPLQIDSDDVAGLSKDELPRVMNRLIRVEASLLHIPPMNIETSLRINDPDGGIDASIQAGKVESRWISSGLSVWQFKAGRTITAASILEEAQKPGVRKALADGGTYYLVVSADFIPTKINEIKSWLDDAIEQVQSSAPHKLFDASAVAEWATEHPIMLFSFNRPVYDIWSLNRWLERQSLHRIPFKADEARSAIIRDIQQRFASDDGPIHLRIQGPSGVGKTRLSLEIFREYQDDQGMILYAPEPPTKEFFYWMAASSSAHAILVVDETTPAQAVRLRSLTEMSEHRLRLLTIGPAEGLGSDIEVYSLKPLSEATLLSIVEATAITLSPEQTRWIARVAKGYVKLATALAKQVARGLITAIDITTTHEVGMILRELLPDERLRKAMRGLALLTRVGWNDELAAEGKVIADFIGIPWNEMREAIGQVAREGLVSKQGRYRYVTPEILALWLAADLWQTRGKDILELLGQLPTTESRQAMIERMTSLAGLQQTSQIIEYLLGPSGPFDDIAVLNDEPASRLFDLLAQGHSQAALAALERLIAPTMDDQLFQLNVGRRYVVRALERLVWQRITFFGAARLLLRLAEVENQTWSNNATGVWKSLFLTYLGGTEVPALERYVLLEETLQANTPRTRELVVEALEQALSISETANAMDESLDGSVPPKRWHPVSREEDHAVRRAALHVLDAMLQDPNEHVREKAQATLFRVARGIVALGLAEEIVSRLEKLEVHDDGQRREAWNTIQTLLQYEGSSLSEEQRTRLEVRGEHFLGSSLHDRLRRYVGRLTIVDTLQLRSDIPEEQRPQNIVAGLADEAVKEPDILRAEIPWLMSKEAENIWYFGHQLGVLDEEHIWLHELVAAAQASSESLFLSAYLQGRADAGEQEWREHLLDEWMRDPSYVSLVFDAIRSSKATARDADRLVELVDHGWLEPIYLGRLVYGGWILSLEALSVQGLLERLTRDASANASEAGLALLAQWIEAQGQDIPSTLTPVAWEFVERSAGDSKPMLDFYWEKVGLALLRQDPVRIVQAILKGVATGNIAFTDERLHILKEALVLNPSEAWNTIGRELLKHEELSYGLRGWFLESHALDTLDPEMLLAWARKEPTQRPVLLAQLTKPKTTITPLVKGLLQEYGPESIPASILHGNFLSGSWWGSMSSHEAQLHEIAKEWLNDPEPNIRLWARHITTEAQRRIPQIQRFEEEDLL